MPDQSRKQQIAKQLGVSVGVLEQYLQLKRAEVMQESLRAARIDAARTDEAAGRLRPRDGVRPY